MKLNLPVHPALFALSPIIFVFAFNRAKVPIGPQELLPPVLGSLAVTALLWILIGLALRSGRRAALVVTLFLVLFFLYGHVEGALGHRPGAAPYLFAIWGLLLAGGAALAIRARGRVEAATAFLNLAGAAILVVNIASGAPAWLRRRPEPVRPKPTASKIGADYPDIYYIILDMYTRPDVLQSYYHTDVSSFVDYLTARGFYVAPRSRSNYAQTYLSLSSSLNFSYLDSVVALTGPGSQDESPLIQMIQDSRVVRFLKARGYTIATFASGYTGTELREADVHWAPGFALSEFQDLLLSTTVLPALLGSRMGTLEDESQRERIRYILRTVPDAARGEHPVFVFAHVVCPHPPFVFDAEGRRPNIIPYLRINQTGTSRQVSALELQSWFRENYGPQVTYLNTLIESAVSQVLAESPRPPVIILQGDHGAGQILSGGNPERSSLERRHAILNAILAPQLPDTSGLQAPTWYDSITPVNTFRVLFDRCLDTTLALLPDRSYFSSLSYPYRLYDIARPETYETGGKTKR